MLTPKLPDPIELNEGLVITDTPSVRVFTGEIDPEIGTVPNVPLGSLYVYTQGNKQAVYQFRTAGWTELAGYFEGTPPTITPAPSNRPEFTITNIDDKHNLNAGMTGYYLIIHRLCFIEFSGISGKLALAEARNSYIIGIGDGGPGPSKDEFPALYQLAPGYYRIEPKRKGTLAIVLHGYAGMPAEPWPSLSWDHTTTQTNKVFTWHGGTNTPWA